MEPLATSASRGGFPDKRIWHSTPNTRIQVLALLLQLLWVLDDLFHFKEGFSFLHWSNGVRERAEMTLWVLTTRPQRPLVDSKQCIRILHQTAQQLFISSPHTVVVNLSMHIPHGFSCMNLPYLEFGKSCYSESWAGRASP